MEKTRNKHCSLGSLRERDSGLYGGVRKPDWPSGVCVGEARGWLGRVCGQRRVWTWESYNPARGTYR